MLTVKNFSGLQVTSPQGANRDMRGACISGGSCEGSEKQRIPILAYSIPLSKVAKQSTNTATATCNKDRGARPRLDRVDVWLSILPSSS